VLSKRYQCSIILLRKHKRLLKCFERSS